MSISGDGLLAHIDELHTTELGALRIQKNLGIETEDVVTWCKQCIRAKEAIVSRKGKNWYVEVNNCRFTINAFSYTIITAHTVSVPDSKSASSIKLSTQK